MSAQEEKLTWLQKLGYGIGDIFGGGSGTLIGFYYLYFLTDVVRLNPGLAGTIILLSKIYDSITDPLEGIIADRTRTRLGRRKPYLLAGIPFIIVSFFFLFYPYNAPEEMRRFALVLASYLFFSTVVSIVMLSYNALHSEMTLDYNERTSLSSARILFSTISSILCATMPLTIVEQFADARTGWMVMALAFGLFFALPFIGTILTVKERPAFQKPPAPFSWRTFFAPFRIRTFVFSLMMYLMAFVAIDTVSSVLVYFMKYMLQRGSEVRFVSGTLLVTQVLVLPVYVGLSKRIGKSRAYLAGAALWFVLMVGSLLIGRESPGWMIYAFAGLVGAATGGIVVMMYAIFPDIPDVDELISGERREAMFSALVTFMRKMSSALAIFLVSQAINLAGYIAPLEEVTNGVTKLVEQPQSEAFLLTLRLLFALVPPALLALAMFFAVRYPLSLAVHERLKGILARKREGEPLTVAELAEEKELIRTLAG